MSENIAISVIMLTYNRENMIADMIKSIQNQSFKDYEYIIIDNGSMDRSGRIAEQYAEVDERIRVIHIEKSSIGKGRNIGIQNARGRYIAFVDDDDICEEMYLEKLLLPIQKSSTEMSVCGTSTSTCARSEVLEGKSAMEVLLDRKLFNVGFPTKLIPSIFYKDDKFDEVSKFDDIYLMPKMIAKATKVYYIGEPLYVVNRHEGNNSAWTKNFTLLSEKILKEYLDVYDRRTEWLCRIFPCDVQLWKYYKWSFYISMIHKIKTYRIADCGSLQKVMEDELKENKDSFLKNNKTTIMEKAWIQELL